MEIIAGEDFKLENSSVSLGKFDGIHRGHRFLLSRVLEQHKYIPTVFTFEMGENSEKIYSQPEKDRILSKLGIQREIIFPFDEQTRNLSAEAFIREVLVEKLDAKYICVGEDFGFGKKREGNVETLRQYQKEFGYGLEIVPKLTCEEEVISSTRVRKLLAQGKMDKVNLLLGEPYFVQGKVAHGKALGRKLQMPTANLIPPEGKLLPPFGVYATMVTVDGKHYPGVTNVGRKPTVGEFSTGVETFIMNFDKDIYQKEIKVSFYQYLRPERKFSDVKALVAQVNKDKVTAAAFFKNHPFPEGDSRFDSINTMSYNI